MWETESFAFCDLALLNPQLDRISFLQVDKVLGGMNSHHTDMCYCPGWDFSNDMFGLVLWQSLNFISWTKAIRSSFREDFEGPVYRIKDGDRFNSEGHLFWSLFPLKKETNKHMFVFFFSFLFVFFLIKTSVLVSVVSEYVLFHHK